MFATLNLLAVLAAAQGASGIPASNPWAKLAVPLGVAVFIGPVYLLLRSNLGTRRGYLVMSVALWGFTSIYALFWTFGAPGTPPVTGPQNLPGQGLDEYEPTWKAFVADSNIANDPRYAVVQRYPQGFGAVPEDFKEKAVVGADEVKNFFSGFDQTSPYTNLVSSTAAPVTDQIRYATATNGYPIIAVGYVPTYQLASSGFPEGAKPPLTVDGAAAAKDGSNVAPPGTKVGDLARGVEPIVLFAYFDAGSPAFPSYVVLGLVLLLFALHTMLLARDESRERREREAERVPDQPEPVGAGTSA
ncbi:MAG: hypothetical protein ACRDYX_09720 [Egibacteraceae bacterium]